MGMQLNTSRGRNGRRGRGPVMSEINVTPFVDVTLVLLIIFMVTAPLVTVGVPVDLPKVSAKGLSEQAEPLVVSLQEDGKVFLQETELALDALVARLQAILEEKPETKVYMRGDKQVAYGKMMQVMGAIHAGGIAKVALLTELPTGVSG